MIHFDGAGAPAIKESIPAGVPASATEVFGLIETTLRCHYAKKLIDGTAAECGLD